MGAIDVILPVHNEGASIRSTLEDFHRVVSEENGFPIRFIVCEDGSTDNSVAVLKEVARRLPLRLVSSAQRKGYSRALVDGMKLAETEWVGFLDGDGQLDPADFALLASRRDGADVVMGWRNPRADILARRMMSGAFGVVYRLLLSVRLRDPSSSYILVRRSALERLLDGNVGLLPQGLWWEVAARASALGLRIVQVPVGHRQRMDGKSRVWRLAEIPRLAAVHLFGLYRLKRELDARPVKGPGNIRQG